MLCSMTEKTQYSGFFVSPGSAKTLVRRGGITNHRLRAYSLSNNSTKNYQNQLICIEVIVCNINVVFWDTVYIHSAPVKREQSIVISLLCPWLCEHISGTAGPIFTNFFVQIPCDRGSVLLWQRCDTLCTSSFYPNVTYVTFESLLSQFRLSSVCLLSVVCNVGAPYSGRWSFRQYFFTAVYAGHPLTSVQNFTEIVLGESLHRERWTQEGYQKYSNFGPIEGYIS